MDMQVPTAAQELVMKDGMDPKKLAASSSCCIVLANILKPVLSENMQTRLLSDVVHESSQKCTWHDHTCRCPQHRSWKT